MEKKKDGSYLFTRDELLNDNIIVASKVYPLSEHEFHVLIENGDTRADTIAGKVFYIALGIILQVLLYLGFVCYYHLKNNKEKVDSTLTHIDEYQIGLLLLCLFVYGVFKIISMCSYSDRKQLISVIMSHFNKKDDNGK